MQPPEGCAPVFISSSDMEKLGYVTEQEYTAPVVSSCATNSRWPSPKTFDAQALIQHLFLCPAF